MLSEVMKTGIPVHLNEHPFVFIEKTGNRNVYLDLDYQPYKEQDGKITGVMAFVHDVTEKIVNRQNIKESEKKIKIAEERALLAIQAANIGTFDINVETGKIVTSERMNEIFGEENFPTLRTFNPKTIRKFFLFYSIRFFLSIIRGKFLHWCMLNGDVLSFSEYIFKHN